MEKIIKDFIDSIDKGPFKELKNNNSVEEMQNINKKDIFYCAVYQGYLDMCRTLNYSKDNNNGKHNKDTILNCLTDLSDKICNFFNYESVTEKDFEEEYYQTFIPAFNGSNTTFGQQQKVINMAFKYLYCCNEIREKKKLHFRWCHMALDGFTLNWYKRECCKDYDNTKWSNLDEEQYISIQSNIRSKFGKNVNVLVSEFKIWEQEQLIDLLKSLISISEKMKKRKFITNTSWGIIPNINECKKIKKELEEPNV